jgi:ATP-binding cassette subfamily F protein uup
MERDALPKKIEGLEAELKQLEAAVAAPDFYKKPSGDITKTMARLGAVPDELLAAYARWDELNGLR